MVRFLAFVLRYSSLAFRILNWQTSLTHFQVKKVSTNIFLFGSLNLDALNAFLLVCFALSLQRVPSFSNIRILRIFCARTRLTLPGGFRLIILAKNRLQNHLNIHKQSASRNLMGEDVREGTSRPLVPNHQLYTGESPVVTYW